MEAQGLVATFEQQMIEGRAYGRQQASDVMTQLMREFNPPSEFRRRLEKIVAEYAIAMEPHWGAKELAEVWSRYYGPAFSNDELDKLLTFYTSPLAQKEVLVSRNSLTQFSKHFQDNQKQVLESATAEFGQKIKAITIECNCKR